MRWIKCTRDGDPCDLDTLKKSCRFIDGLWQGKCFDRFETKEELPETTKQSMRLK